MPRPTNTEKLMKFSPVLANIFDGICRFLPSCPKSIFTLRCHASALGTLALTFVCAAGVQSLTIHYHALAIPLYARDLRMWLTIA